jgi:hypothetical protein
MKVFSRIIAVSCAAAMSVSMLASCNQATAADVTLPSEYVDYATALQEALYLYDANMCGKDVEKASALDWRSACHTFDDSYTYNGKTVDLSGGFHDAGDHVKFGLPAAYSAYTLGNAYRIFPDAFTETNQDKHLEAITNRFAEYFRKCAIYENGKVVSFAYQVGTGGGEYDHGYWGSPELQPQVNAETGNARIAYFTDDKNLNADIVGATIAALAMNYINFGNKKDLQAAIDLHTYLAGYTDIIVADTSDDTDDLEIVSTVPQYARWEDGSADPNGPWDYIYIAELTLKLATGKDEYMSIINAKLAADETFAEIGKQYTPFPPNWDGVWPFVNLLKGEMGDEEAFKKVKGSNLGTGVSQYINWNRPNLYGFVQQWGSARLNCNFQFLGLAYEKLTADETLFYSNWSKEQMDYLFGKNDHAQAFVVGYNYREDIKYPQFPHHRAASSPAYGNTVTGHGTTPQSHVLIGALVGGQLTQKNNYTDSAEDYLANEVGLDYSAGYIGALAGLYETYQNTGKATIINPPSGIAVGVEDTYKYWF